MKRYTLIAAVALALGACAFNASAADLRASSTMSARDGVSMLSQPSAAAREHGFAEVAHSRPCQPGYADVTSLPQIERDRADYMSGGKVCGTIWNGSGEKALTYWGQKRILSHTFSGTTAPAAGAWYIALLTATPANAGVAWGSVSELASSGYSRANVASWTCTTSTSANNSCNTGSISWTNSSGSAYTGVTAMAVVDASGGAPTTYGYLLFIALSTTRTLQNGDSLTINPFTLTLQ